MATDFKAAEGVNHNHRPSGQWKEVQKNINSPDASFLVPTICENSDPSTVVFWARASLTPIVDGSESDLAFRVLPQTHVDHYLKGKGADFDENAALKKVLLEDDGVRKWLVRRLPTRSSGPSRPNYDELKQQTYSLDWAKNSWGSIDKLYYEVDFDAETVHVWFKDRYEWHPYYPKLYSVEEGDHVRPTNCVHAAFVEMKSEGAEDFWMVGEATVPLKGFPGYKGKDGKGGGSDD